MADSFDDGDAGDAGHYYAWYSPTQKHVRRKRGDHRSIYWKNANGIKVEVTMVAKTPDHGCVEGVLDDIRYVGIVHKFAGLEYAKVMSKYGK